jgi:quinol monooxygenase YgiN
MIRSVVLVELVPDADLAEVAAVQAGFREQRCPGTLSYTLGDDLGLREGNWSFAIVADFRDEESYRAYDVDERHNAWRERLKPHAARIARVQFELPDPAGGS